MIAAPPLDNKTNVKTPGFFIIGGIDSDVTRVVVQVMRGSHERRRRWNWRRLTGSGVLARQRVD